MTMGREGVKNGCEEEGEVEGDSMWRVDMTRVVDTEYIFTEEPDATKKYL